MKLIVRKVVLAIYAGLILFFGIINRPYYVTMPNGTTIRESGYIYIWETSSVHQLRWETTLLNVAVLIILCVLTLMIIEKVEKKKE